MTKKKVAIWLILVGAIALAGVVSIILFQKKADPRTAGLTKVPGYNHVEEGQITCAAISPACGTCFGEVINDECFVDKAKLTPEELQLMGF